MQAFCPRAKLTRFDCTHFLDSSKPSSFSFVITLTRSREEKPEDDAADGGLSQRSSVVTTEDLTAGSLI